MLKSVHHDIYAGLVIAVMSLFFLLKTSELPERAALYPNLILYLFLFFAVLIIINGLKKSVEMKKDLEVPQAEDEERLTPTLIKGPVVLLIVVTGYVLLMGLLGFFASTALFMIAILYVLKLRSVKVYILTILFTLLFIYVLFVKLLNVFLPTGILF